MNEDHDPVTALLDLRRMPSRIPGLTGEKAREWREFWRWAAAAEVDELPDGGFRAAAVLASVNGSQWRRPAGQHRFFVVVW